MLKQFRGLEIYVDRVPHNGMLVLTTEHNGLHHKMRYVDYTLNEALARFAEQVLTIKKG